MLDNLLSIPNILIFVMGVFLIINSVGKRLAWRKFRKTTLEVSCFFGDRIEKGTQGIVVRLHEVAMTPLSRMHSVVIIGKRSMNRVTISGFTKVNTWDDYEFTPIVGADTILAFSSIVPDKRICVQMGKNGVPFFSDLSLLNSGTPDKPIENTPLKALPA